MVRFELHPGTDMDAWTLVTEPVVKDTVARKSNSTVSISLVFCIYWTLCKSNPLLQEVACLKLILPKVQPIIKKQQLPVFFSP